MDSVLVMQEPRTVIFQEYEPQPLEADQVRLRTLYSGISAGTEMTIYRGSNPYAQKRWDPELKLFLAANEDPRLYPCPLGYEEVGYVAEAGPDVDAKELPIGSLVYGSWSHRTEVVLPARIALQNQFWSEDPRHGIFARIGAIALNGVLDAQINVGETIAVFGAGVVGLTCMALGRLSGARVFAVDINPARLRHAERYADELLGEEAALRIKNMTNRRGADVVIEATGSDAALNEAIRSVAYAGKVISLGFYQNNARGLYLGEEFHHNRVQIICSQIFAVNPALSYRWDVQRLERTIMALQAAGRLELTPLITHEIPFREAPAAYQLLEEHPDAAVQIVLTYPDAIAECAARRRAA
jgi:2-desacetyl-2-hydroxyethyl bacteriochlorophyllide A dehydrogenase